MKTQTSNREDIRTRPGSVTYPPRKMAAEIVDGQPHAEAESKTMKPSIFNPKSGIRFLCVAALWALAAAAQLPAQNTGATFTPGPNMNTARMWHHIAPLPGGKAIVFGGHTPGFDPSGTAEIFDSVANTWTSLNMNSIRDYSAFTKLNDGRYLLAGGMSGWGGTGQLNTAEIYDPVTNTFSPTTGTMSIARTACAAATLISGKVLVAGNWYADASYAEVFDPATGLFTRTGPVNTQRAYGRVLPTSDGGAVLFGGLAPYGLPWLDQVEYYDPQTNSFSVLQNSLLGDGQNYTVYDDFLLDPGSRRLPDGRYIFQTYDSSSNQVIYTFNPHTRQFAKLNTTPQVPPPGSKWIHSLVVDSPRSKVYALSYDTAATAVRLHALNPDTGELNVPPDFHSLGRPMYGSGASIALSDGRLLWTGGTTGDNFSAQNATLLATPADPTAPAPISIKRIGGSVQIAFTGKLQRWSEMQTWVDVDPQPTSPVTIEIQGRSAFWRARLP